MAVKVLKDVTQTLSFWQKTKFPQSIVMFGATTSFGNELVLWYMHSLKQIKTITMLIKQYQTIQTSVLFSINPKFISKFPMIGPTSLQPTSSLLFFVICIDLFEDVYFWGFVSFTSCCLLKQTIFVMHRIAISFPRVKQLMNFESYVLNFEILCKTKQNINWK